MSHYVHSNLSKHCSILQGYASRLIAVDLYKIFVDYIEMGVKLLFKYLKYMLSDYIVYTCILKITIRYK